VSRACSSLVAPRLGVGMSEPVTRSFAEVEAGASLGELAFDVSRADLIRYAGASLDFNPIHWSERAAERAGLPDVIAHGMLTMALAARLATNWARDPGAVRSYSVRFSAVVPVPAHRSARITVSGSVVTKLDNDRVAVELTVTSDERQVLKHVYAVLQLAQ